jgi:crotonobetainyl-CoA:carnitine CoA-transferase CaiB-like acyl-CoA transferase
MPHASDRDVPLSSALEGLRIVEVASLAGAYAGKLFANLGAEVILVEPPGGAAARYRSPFVDGRPGPDRSLEFFYLNTGKRSVTLDLDTAEGQAGFRALVAQCDLVIEGERPGLMAQRGLAYSDLVNDAPGLVVTSITPFGQTGPYSLYESEDLVALAMGGFLTISGYPDREPTRIPGNQSFLMAGLYGAIGSMLAILERDGSGTGQHVDVSIQECVVMALENTVQFYDLEGQVRRRSGLTQRYTGAGLFPCKGGYVYIFVGGLAATRFWGELVRWLREEGAAGVERLYGEHWTERNFRETKEARDTFAEVFGPFAKERTSEQLYYEAQRRRIPLSPVATAADVVGNRQIRDRGFIVSLFSPALDREIAFPGAPYLLSRTPWAAKSAPPRAGEHNDEIMGALGTWPARNPWGRIGERPAVSPPLAGIRVADFSWIGAGPFTTKLLSDFGADVIRIESGTRVDPVRLTPPFKDGVAGVNRSGYFTDRNTNKRSITLNLKTEEGRALARQLVAQSDVVVNNFSVGTMDKLGLGYDEMSKLKPDLIYLSMSMQGATGPDKDFIGFGLTIASLAGLQYLTGPSDRMPVGTGTNFPDHIPNPCHGAFAVLAALRHRRQSGQGQFIDLAQTEPTIAVLGPAIMEYTVNGTVPERSGNDHPDAAPHGVYSCAGDDRWIAICVMEDVHWDGLRDVLGRPAWADAPQWASREGRLRDRREIDARLAVATSTREPYELMRALQEKRVPAGVLQRGDDLVLRDPQLAERSHWVRLDHPEMGNTINNAPPFRFSRSSSSPTRPAPLLGEHTSEICRDLLGLSPEHVETLRSQGVLA